MHQLSDELRQYIIDTVSVHGGHFAASLGVVELTVALHYVFNTPYDQLVWDVGHQAYMDLYKDPHWLAAGSFYDQPQIRWAERIS